MIDKCAARAAGTLGVLLLLAPMTGCGGCSKPPLPDPRVEEEEEEFVAPGSVPPAGAAQGGAADAATSGAAAASGDTTADGSAQTSAAASAPPVDPSFVGADEEFVDPSAVAARRMAESNRPRDLAEWTAENFLAARRENDPNLARAATLLGERSAGDGATAGLLIQLLQMRGATDDAGGSSLDNDPDLARALIGALGATETAIGRELLKQLLRGKARTPFDDFAATSAAIRALAAHPSPENDDILFVLLTRPEQVRPRAEGGVTADSVRDETLAAVQLTLSPEMRVRLARHLIDPATSADEQAGLLPLLTDPHLENLAAQVVLYGSDRVAGETRTRVQNAFGAFSAAALDRLLGVPLEAAATDDAIVDPRLFDTAAALSTAQALWGGAFGEAMAVRVQGLTDVEAQRELLRLACNVPSPAIRTKLYGAFQQHWVEGTAGFGDGRVELRQIRDPGFLLVLKSLPREDDPRRRRRDGTADDETPPPADGGNPARNQAIERIRKERAAKYAWMDLSEQFVRHLNGRLHAAALTARERSAVVGGGLSTLAPGAAAEVDPFAPGGAAAISPDAGADGQIDPPASPGEDVNAGDRLPFELHPGAKVSLQYRRRWPADLSSGDAPLPVAYLDVHYLRLEVDDVMGKLVGHYNRQLNRSGDHFTHRGRWLESVERDAQTGRARSIDVLISRHVDEAPIARDVAEKLTVEILVVEVPDPTGPAADGLAKE